MGMRRRAMLLFGGVERSGEISRMMRPGQTKLPSSIVLLSIFAAIISCNAWLTTPQHYYRLSHFKLSVHNQDERYPLGEVIGSTGKIGSYILNSINSPVVPIESINHQYPQCLPAAATPRGVSPGCLSPENTPLYACIPSSAIQTVWDATVPHRRKDLVFLCNCIPSRHLNFYDSSCDFTICIIHFGVSHASNATTSSSHPIPILNTSPQSPATVVYGRHATTLAELLRRDGISVDIASSAQQLQMVAAKKLAWSSLFWLLCHDSNKPMTVKEVWERKSKQIYELVEEMLPALEKLASEPWTTDSDTEQTNAVTREMLIGTVQEVYDYLHAYSMSMKHGQITPSLELALNEIQERNGVLLSLMVQADDNYRVGHPRIQLEIIRRVAGEQYLARCLSTDKVNDVRDIANSVERVSCKASNLQFLYHPTKKTSHAKSSQSSVIIIGAGIIGSSLAHHLSRRGGFKITVLDKSTNLLPVQDQDDEIYPGVATSSSFAWLNANDKSPLSYMQLNQLGMEMWRRHDMLKEYPVWSGALIRKEKQHTCEKNSRYVCVGPLDCDDAKSLEPGIDFEDESSEFYFYPEEGFIEPAKVVEALRLSARRNGVNFIGGAEIASLIRNKQGKVSGVEYKKSGSTNIIRASADVVINACGANSASPSLGMGSERLPLVDEPGALTYVSSGRYLKHPLTRIFVDTINQVHMLRRSDDTLVIGGGKLIVGGSHSDDDSTDKNNNKKLDVSFIEEADSAVGQEMIAAAMKSIESCSENNGDSNFRVTKANRPMSADGLPVVGFVEQGLYVAVTHSGITLAPIIGELASYEIEDSLSKQNPEELFSQERCGFQILDAYRPTRFT